MSGIVGGLNTRGSGLVNLGSAADGTVYTGTGAGMPIGFEAAGGGFYESIASVGDQVAYNVSGQGITNGAWRIRRINTEFFDPDGIVSIASDQFTLGAGTYTLFWDAVGKTIGTHFTKIYNVTDAADITNMWGLQQTNYSTTSSTSCGNGVMTIAGTKAFELRHRADTTNSSSGGGSAQVNDSAAFCRYSMVTILKHA